MSTNLIEEAFSNVREHEESTEASTVLVVDDNSIDRLRAGRIVEQESHCRTVYAENASQALAKLAEEEIAIVLTDLKMEAMDGLDLVKTVRRDHPAIPVILMTAQGGEDVAIEALRLGATDYIRKQGLTSELQPVLARALRTARSGHQRRRCLQALIGRESRFELENDPELLPSLLEYLQEEMIRLDRWDPSERMRISIALDEALRNALFHGNLGIGSDLRDRDDHHFNELAQARMRIPPFNSRRIHLIISHEADESRFVIRDEGTGFDTSRVERLIEPEDLLRPSGRGLLLMKSFMTSISFNRAGNQVVLVKERKTEPPGFGQGTPKRPECASDRDTAVTKALPRSRIPVDFLKPTSSITHSRTTRSTPSQVVDASLHGEGTLEPHFYKQLLDQLHDAVYFVDTQRRILYWNKAAEQLTGYSREEVLGRRCLDGLLQHKDKDGCRLCNRECPLLRSMNQRQKVQERLFMKHRDGRWISVDVRIMPIHDDKGDLIGSVEIFCDATEHVLLQSAYRQIREAADRDPLTGLANRRCIDWILAKSLRESETSSNPFSIIMVDIDHFKQINDTWGHAVGDKALVQFAGSLRQQCRPNDMIARLGGEEFLILLPGHALETAIQIAERLRVNVKNVTPVELGGRSLSASFGVAQAIAGETTDQFLQRADAALYRAKSNGRDRVESQTTSSETKSDPEA